MALILKLRRKALPPIEPIPFSPQARRDWAHVPLGVWIAAKDMDPPFPGRYDCKCEEGECLGSSGNLWDGENWFWSELDKAVGPPKTNLVRRNWFWRMPS